MKPSNVGGTKGLAYKLTIITKHIQAVNCARKKDKRYVKLELQIDINNIE